MNQELTEYIKAQLAAGVTDDDIKKALNESGWAGSDIEAAFEMLKHTLESMPPEEIKLPVETSEVTKYDLGIPKEQETGIPEPNELSEKKDILKTEAEPGKSKNIGKIILVIIILGLIGMGIWMAAKSLSGWIEKKEEKPLITISPETETMIPNPTGVIEEGIIQIDLLSPTIYSSKKGSFEIYPPKDWTIDDSGSFGTLLSIGNKVSDIDGENKFMANINVVSEAVGNITLENYLSASKEVLKTSFTDYQLIGEKKVDLKGVSGIMLDAKYNMGVYPLHNFQLMIVHNNNAYVITATAMESTWNKYKDIFEASMMSFTLK